MSGTRRLAMGLAVVLSMVHGIGGVDRAAAQAKPEGEMRWALYVTVPPAWFDPGESSASHTVLDPLRAARRRRQADAGQPPDAEPGRVLDDERRSEDATSSSCARA